MPLVVCVVSRTRGRGKTGLVERLAKRFNSEGFTVATVKHISGSFDTAKKDTWRHLEAGAVMTVASTSNEMVTITRTKNPTLKKALDAIYLKPDLIFVEGYKKSSYPKILCADTAEEAQAAAKEISNIVIVSGLIASNAEEKEKFEEEFVKNPVYDFEEVVSKLKEMMIDSILKNLPGLNCKHCGYDSCREFAKAILSGEATMRQCEVLATDIATLKVDGKTVPVGKFPQQIIRGVTLGVLETLKGVRKHPHRIEILVNADVEEGADQ
jgi:molybdopterin-guanine dinucleotide biosynthesis protein B